MTLPPQTHDPLHLLARLRQEGRAWPIEERLRALEVLGRLGDPRLDRAEHPWWRDLPAATVLMGGDPALGDAPLHRVRHSAFRMAWSPVTVQDFEPFVADAPHHTPALWEEQRRAPNRPVVGVSWYDARAYVAWANASGDPSLASERWRMALPTEAQWEYAARGPEGREHPWGDEAPEQGDDPHANFDARLHAPSPVGAHPRGDTPLGLSDMGGNVWEWCLDDWRDEEDEALWEPDLAADRAGHPLRDPCHPADRAFTPEDTPEDDDPREAARVLRGASWLSNPSFLRTTRRGWFHPSQRFDYVGFRVCWVRAEV